MVPIAFQAAFENAENPKSGQAMKHLHLKKSALAFIYSLLIIFNFSLKAQDQENFEAFEKSEFALAWEGEQKAAGYFNSLSKKLVGEAELQVKLFNSFSSDYSPTYNNRLLNELLGSESRVASHLNKLNIKAQQKIPNAFSVLSNGTLHGLWHELMFNKTGSIEFGENSALIAKRYKKTLSAIDKELASRGSFLRFNNKENRGVIQRRFELVAQINESARLESLYLIDRSPEVVSEQLRIVQFYNEIKEIDLQLGVSEELLPKMRDLLTSDTMNERLKILQMGKKSVQVEHYMTREYFLTTGYHLEKIEAQEAQEKKWILQREIEAITRSNGYRGPPYSSPDPIFKLPPGISPRSFQDIDPDLTLDKFIDSEDVQNISSKDRKGLAKLWKQRKKLLGALLDNGTWSTAYFDIPKGTEKEFVFGTPEYLKARTQIYYESLSIDPVKAASLEAELTTIYKNIYPDQPLTGISAWLGDDPITTSKILEILDNGIRAREEISVKQGIHTPFHIKEEINLLTNARKTVSGHLDMIVNRVAEGLPVTRPPPIEFTEALFKRITQAQIENMKLLRVRYGTFEPASIVYWLNKLNLHQEINTIANNLTRMQEMKPYRTLLHTLNIAADGGMMSEQLSDKLETLYAIEDWPEFEAKLASLESELRHVIQKTSRLGARELLSADFYTQLEQGKNLSTQGSRPQVAKQDISKWRASPELTRFNELSGLKDPGGIWLTPDGEVPICETNSVQWTVETSYYGQCWHEDAVRWQLDDEHFICFPKKDQPTIDHWLKNVMIW